MPEEIGDEPNKTTYASQPLNTSMGAQRTFRITSGNEIDHLVNLYDNGEIGHSPDKTALVKMCLGLDFSSGKSPHPYSGHNLCQWAVEGTILIPKTPAFFIEHNQIPTPSNLLCVTNSVPSTIFCLKPALAALHMIAQSQEVDMYQDLYASELTFLFKLKE